VRLRSVEVIPYALPFREPYVTARGTLTRREMVLLRLRDEEGLEGLGEAVPLSLRGGVTIETVVRELEGVAAELAGMDASEGTPPSIADLPASASAIEGGVPRRVGARLSLPALCALSTAWLDLQEKQAGSGTPTTGVTASGSAAAQADPVTEPVRCNATLVTAPPAAVAEEARRWAADRFGTFKLKVGAGEDVAQVEAVRVALGPEAKIRLDANAAWSLEEAIAILAAVEPLGIELVEQPVATIEEAARLATTTSIPLAGDESIVTVADAEAAVAAGAFQTTGIKLSKVGGIEAGAAIDAILPAYVASALDGPVGIAAGRRLAARIDAGHVAGSRLAQPIDALHPLTGRAPLAHGLATQRLFAATIAAVECELRGDQLHPPPGPGLGVVIDEEALDAHRL
jgi:L-alanine-DL-glutamate epimerase-like enolase superfamily enzyme